MTLFTSSWTKFTNDFKKNLTHLTQTVGDSKGGQVKRVSDLESEVKTLKATPLTNTGGEAVDGQRLTQLQDLANKYEELKAKFEKIVQETPEGGFTLKTADLMELQEDFAASQRDIATLSGYVHIMGKEITYLDHKTLMNATKLMKNNIIVGGVRTSPTHPPKGAFMAFLHNLLQINPQDYDVWEVEVLGEGYTKWIQDKEIQFPPPLRARCSESLASSIMNNASKLKDKKNQEGIKYYVKRSKPVQHRAVREKNSHLVKQYREENDKAEKDEDKTEYYFSGTCFFVNKKVVEEPITPPTPKDMLNLSDTVLQAMETVQFASSMQKELQLSKLQAFATKVHSTDDIDLAYMRMCNIHHFADYILLGYHFQDEGTIKQGCTSDRQHNREHKILKLMQKYRAINTAVFLVLEYGGIPLGGARFENIRSHTTQALRELQPDTLDSPQLPPQRSRGHPGAEVLAGPGAEGASEATPPLPILSSPASTDRKLPCCKQEISHQPRYC